MEPALATIAALEARLRIAPGTLADTDLAKAVADLEDASNLVRAETGKSWLDAQNNPVAPGPVETVVLRAALRCYRNPDEFSSETEDGYTWRREPDSVTPYLTDAEIRLLARYASGSSARLYTLPTTRTGPEECYFLRDQFGGDLILNHDSSHLGPW
jgi:hypothetical protein